MRCIDRFMDDIGQGETGIDAAALESDLVRNVVAPRMHAASALGQRVFGRQERRKFLIIDPDQIQCVAGYFLADGGDRGDFLAGEYDPAFSQDAALLVMHAPSGSGRVGSRQYRLDARQGAGGGNVDAGDARMRIGAAQHFRVQHARQLDVAGVLGAAQYLGASGHLRHRGADRR